MRSYKDYTVGKRFVEDHWSRDCGDESTVISCTANTYTLRLTVDQYDDLLSDADYYYDAREEIKAPKLCQAAKRTRDALLKQGPPEGYKVIRRGYKFCVVKDEVTP